MRNIQFNSKETYLAYRSEWKAEYKRLSKEIREERIQIRSQRGIESIQYWYLKGLREQATAMLEERKASKVEAQRQYLQARLDFEDAQKEQYVES